MADVRDDVRAAFENALQDAIPDVDIEFENIKFEQPKELYASCWLQYSLSRRAAIAQSRRFDRHTGFFCVDLYAPEGSGTHAMLLTSSLIEAAFNAQTFNLPNSGYITCLVAKIVNGPLIKDGYIQKTVMVPFILDACSP
jgi:hypothetical protein